MTTPMMPDGQSQQRPSTIQQHEAPVGMKDIVDQTPQLNEEPALENDTPETVDTMADEKCITTEPVRRVRTIGWDGPNDPDNPKNWTQTRKWASTLTVAMFTFISPIASSMVAPALSDVARDLNVPPGFQTSLLLSIFILSYAFGPLLLGPLSEVFGRTRVLQSSFMFFMVFCLACGLAQNKAQFFVFRIISGLGGSAPLAVGPGVLSDLWPPEQRGKALGYYTAGPLLGPAIGPIFGGFIAQDTTWRWVFWATAAYTGLVQIVGLFVLRETYAPILLARKAAQTANSSNANDSQVSVPKPQLSILLAKALKRPMFLLFTQPIIQALALYQLYNYGTIYLILTTFPNVWIGVYHEKQSIGGLNYLSIGVGFLLASIVAAPLNDKIYVHLKRTRGNGKGRPEFRVPLMFPASLFCVAGLFIYGWTVQFRTHWIFPNIGMFIFSIGCIVSYQCAQTYNIDAYSKYAASGMAAVVMLRSIAGFGFPLFAPAMYDALGYGWGNSLLGFIAIGIGMTAPLAFWLFGEKMRTRSSHARSE
ncbi:hypothetical protein PMZ80_000229 [Knufia obscura]|uniref:Major facilitator superfamily (MFS) profile domain-containing protein n=1 Tax=Knufia obscura TaxID=1635080 RepID=A0ABR0RZS8_9EURO|nr:hypothetical protein PMZ80_000229 [Knufia obscura]